MRETLVFSLRVCAFRCAGDVLLKKVSVSFSLFFSFLLIVNVVVMIIGISWEDDLRT